MVYTFLNTFFTSLSKVHIRIYGTALFQNVPINNQHFAICYSCLQLLYLGELYLNNN